MSSAPGPPVLRSSGAAPARTDTDPVGLSWLVTVRGTTTLAGIGAIVAGRGCFATATSLMPTLLPLAVQALTNVWFAWRVRRGPTPGPAAAGSLVALDVMILSWLLLRSGGVLNPVSIFYLVQIVLAALVLGRTWTWIVAALSVAGYGALFLVRTEEFDAAVTMHPEIWLHVRGMWLAFAVTATLVGLLVARLATAVARRDRALAALQAEAGRTSRLASLATLAAGAAHELSTPLGTIAVAAHELERSLGGRAPASEALDDARLIRREIDRCRRILDDLSGRITEPSGEVPRHALLADISNEVLAHLSPADRARVRVSADRTASVRWPVGPVAQAVVNLVNNGLQASAVHDSVDMALVAAGTAVTVTVTDRGRGMTPEEAARAGEPFFTTKPTGKGMGLGLFVARAAIEQLGGTLTVSSRPGAGTVATVHLPSDVFAREDAGS